MIELKPHTPEVFPNQPAPEMQAREGVHPLTELPTMPYSYVLSHESVDAREGLAEKVRSISQEAEAIRGLELAAEEEKTAEREMAFVIPGDAHHLTVLVDPSIAPEVFKEHRFCQSIENDLGLNTHKTLLPYKFFSQERGLFDPHDNYAKGDDEYTRQVDKTMVTGNSGSDVPPAERMYAVNEWLKIEVSGDPQMISHPDIGRVLGALLAREVKESKSEHTEEVLVMEDLTRLRPSKKQLVVASQETDLATEITEELEIPDLDRAIRREMSNPFDKILALGKAATNSVLNKVDPHRKLATV